MNINELNSFYADLEDQMVQVNAQIKKHTNAEALEMLTDTWHSINNRMEDVEARIAADKRRKVYSPSSALAAANID